MLVFKLYGTSKRERSKQALWDGFPAKEKAAQNAAFSFADKLLKGSVRFSFCG
ncbi:hypothetical protein MR810_01075 [bacterium]|nr:hypothetical protein [bacterium]MDD6046486.1 hypothetical protein [bacterium]